MNLIRLSWKNLTYKPLTMMLSIVLFALGVGLISLLFLLEHQLQKNFERNLAGIDLVVGAKGSPLQLILSSMYHIDAPTGNISIKEATPFLNPEHPLIEKAIPLAMGDSYRSYRIVGTTADFLEMYDAQVAEGKLWEYNFEVTVGAGVADKLGMGLGDEFKSSHGFMEDENLEHDHQTSFKVVGILEPTGTVADQLILTTIQSYWLVHDHEGEDHEHEEEDHDHEGEDHEHEGEDHDHEGHDHDHDHEGHDHDHDHEGHDHDHEGHDHDHEGHDHDHSSRAPRSLLEEDEDREITSLLIRFGSQNFQALNMQRNINENTDMQAATPAIEINRLYTLMNTGERALRILAFVIVIVSGLSIFISLFNSLKERRYELALMRVMGGTRGRLFGLIITEGMLLALIGFVVGIILSHTGMHFFAGAMEQSYRYSFSGLEFLPVEGLLLVGAMVIGFLASFIPALDASRTDISDTLTGG